MKMMKGSLAIVILALAIAGAIIFAGVEIAQSNSVPNFSNMTFSVGNMTTIYNNFTYNYTTNVSGSGIQNYLVRWFNQTNVNESSIWENGTQINLTLNMISIANITANYFNGIGSRLTGVAVINGSNMINNSELSCANITGATSNLCTIIGGVGLAGNVTGSGVTGNLALWTNSTHLSNYSMGNIVNFTTLSDYINATIFYGNLTYYVNYSELANYINTTEFYNNLSNYVNFTRLADYINATELYGNLSNYINLTIFYGNLSYYVNFTALANYINATEFYGNLTDYVNASDLYSNLSTYANRSDLLGYVNYTNLSNAADYVNKSMLYGNLSNYVNQTEFYGNLSDYVNATTLYGNITNWSATVNSSLMINNSNISCHNVSGAISDLCNMVAPTYPGNVTGTGVAGDLAVWVNASHLSNYSLSSLVNFTNLANYVNFTELANYVNFTQLANYVNYTNLASYINQTELYDNLSYYINFTLLAGYVNMSDLVHYVNYSNLSTYINASDVFGNLSYYVNQTTLYNNLTNWTATYNSSFMINNTNISYTNVSNLSWYILNVTNANITANITGSGTARQLAIWYNGSELNGSSKLIWNGSLLNISGDVRVLNLTVNGSIDFGDTNNTDMKTLMKVNENDMGLPSADGFRLIWNGSYVNTFNDYLVFQKTDSNDPIWPDGGFAFEGINGIGTIYPYMIISGTGYVGINNTYPNSTLDVIGNAAIGSLNNASGVYALAQGYSNKAEGFASSAFGEHNNVSGAYSTIFGYYGNLTGGASVLISLGTGSVLSLSNVFAVLGGNTSLGTNASTQRLDVNGSVNISGIVYAGAIYGYPNYTDLANYANYTTLANYVNFTEAMNYLNISNLSTYMNATDVFGNLSYYMNFTQLANYPNYSTLAYYVNYTNLASYVNVSELINYVTYSNLSSYANISSLADYINATELYSNLSKYVNVTGLYGNLSSYANVSELVNYVNYSNLSTYANVSELINYINVTNFTALNDSKAANGTCPAGQVIQNATVSGVQCVPASNTDLTGYINETMLYGNLSYYVNFTHLASYVNISNLIYYVNYSNLSTYMNSSDVFGNLSNYVNYTNLANYINTSILYGNLSSYINQTELYGNLSDYINSTALYGNLSSYINKTAFYGNLSSYANVSDLIAYVNYSNLSTYANISELVNYINASNFTDMNNSKAANGTCGYGEVIQNATATGVQCVPANYVNLSDSYYVNFTQLANYVNFTNLANYVNFTELAKYINITNLSSYMNTTDVFGNLSYYINQTEFYGNLTNYVNSTNLYGNLSSYINASDVFGNLSSYANYSTLADYVNATTLYSNLSTYANMTYSFMVTKDSNNIINNSNVSAINVTPGEFADGAFEFNSRGAYSPLTLDASATSTKSALVFKNAGGGYDIEGSGGTWNITKDGYIYAANVVNFTHLESYVNFTNLGNYVNYTNLADYINFTILSGYVNATNLYANLSAYINQTEFYGNLSDYVNSTNLYGNLSDYVNASILYGNLSNYINQTELYGNLSNYVNATTLYGNLTDYVNYTNLANYVNFTHLANYVNFTNLANYVNFTNLANYVNITNLYGNLTYYVNYTDYASGSIRCYQETSNISTGCGGLNTGVYSVCVGAACGDLDNPYTNAFDGNWNTGVASTLDGEGFDMYVNYTKPVGASSSSLWQIKVGITTTNLSIPSTCWNYNSSTLIMKMNAQTFPNEANVSCYDGAFEVLGTYVTDAMYEDAMWWNYTIIPNLSSYINQTELYSNLSNYVNQTTLYANITNWTATMNSSLMINNSNISAANVTPGIFPNGTFVFSNDDGSEALRINKSGNGHALVINNSGTGIGLLVNQHGDDVGINVVEYGANSGMSSSVSGLLTNTVQAAVYAALAGTTAQTTGSALYVATNVQASSPAIRINTAGTGFDILGTAGRWNVSNMGDLNLSGILYVNGSLINISNYLNFTQTFGNLSTYANKSYVPNLTSKTCAGTDKVSAIDNTTGAITCTADVGGSMTGYINETMLYGNLSYYANYTNLANYVNFTNLANYVNFTNLANYVNQTALYANLTNWTATMNSSLTINNSNISCANVSGAISNLCTITSSGGSGNVTGSGTGKYLSMWYNASTINNSQMLQNASEVIIESINLTLNNTATANASSIFIKDSQGKCVTRMYWNGSHTILGGC